MIEYHGGNIYVLAERLGMDERGIIDFSASINPLGVPESAQTAVRENMKYLFNYPDPDTKKLRMKIAEHAGASPDSIVCGNGSTELIYLIVRALRPERVLVPAPTFSEYERAVKCGGSRLRSQESRIGFFPLEKENNFDMEPEAFISAMSGGVNYLLPALYSLRSFDMAFLCNPNNPTGRLIKRAEMMKIADAAKKIKCTLVVDEAFIDFCPGESMIEEVANNPFLIVLRSLTKMYALSGLRIGYAVLPPSLRDIVKGAKEPWTVNTLAQAAGIAALDDRSYRDETFRVIEKEKAVLEEGFSRLGMRHFPSAVNYYLLQIEKAGELGAFLAEKGILARDCSNFRGLDGSYIRVAVKAERDNLRLLEEVSLWAA